MNSARADRPSFGFTLIELLIVIAIIGILAAASIPVFSTFTTSQRLSQAAKQVKNDLRSAQNRAINNVDGKAWGILFVAANNYSYDPFKCEGLNLTTCTCTTTTYLSTKSLASSFTITPVTRDRVIFESISGNVCDPRGPVLSAAPAQIVISLSGSSRTITVSAGGKIEEQ